MLEVLKKALMKKKRKTRKTTTMHSTQRQTMVW
jgi:hypothetical protein